MTPPPHTKTVTRDAARRVPPRGGNGAGPAKETRPAHGAPYDTQLAARAHSCS